MRHLLLRHGTLIDGNGGQPLSDAAVLIEGNHIRAVAHQDDIRLPDEQLTEIDLGGGFILPGFIDCHVHLVLEDVGVMNLLTTPLSLTFFRAIAYMRRTLEAGVTSVRDTGGADLGIKQAVEQGLVVGPRMQISITVLSTTGGHLDYWMTSGNEYHLFPAYPGRPDGICDGLDEVRKKVREVLRAGAEVIKICATGGTLSPTDHPEFTQFSPEELEVMVQEAAFRRGIKVIAHAQGAPGIKNAVRAGIHSIEHGNSLDDEAIELMLERGTFLVPTLLAPVAILEANDATGDIPEWGVRKVLECIEIHRESMIKAHKAGVRIAMGTDAPLSPHGTNLRELGLMCDLGISPMDSIVAATRVASECLGWQERVGTVEAGKLADIVVCKANPLANIRALEDKNNLLLVIKDGEIVMNDQDGP